MQDRIWRILLVEDDEDDFILTRQMLAEIPGRRIELEWVSDSQSALELMRSALIDAVLVDYHIGPENGLDLIRQAAGQGLRLPFILLTGQGSYEIDLEAMQAGATDYLSKVEVSPVLLERTIRYAVERYRLLESNRRQQELLEGIFDLEPGGLVVFTGSELRVTYVNRTFQQMLPDPAVHPTGKTLSELYTGANNSSIRHYASQVIKDGESLDIDRFEIIYPDGARHFFNLHFRPLFLQEEPAVLLVIWEITALEETQRMLQQAVLEANRRAAELNTVMLELETERSRLNTIIANAPSGIVMVDQEARIVLANPIAETIYARLIPYGQAYQQQAELKMCFPNGAPYEPRQLPHIRSALDGETFLNVEMLVIRPNGQRRSILANTSPIHDSKGRVTGAVAVFIDITEHKKAEEEVRKSLAQIEVQRRLMQSREKERLRIAQDLHDGPLQNLIGITFEIKDLTAGITEPAPRQQAEALEAALQNTIKEIRVFSSQLRPPVLTPFGLEKAIQSHAGSFQTQHPEMQIHLELDEDGRRLNEEVRLVLFRIVQELLNNIVRHAAADNVWIRMKLAPTEVMLEVQDNGCGFDVPTSWVEMARQGHLGLVGVQERAGSVNGFVDILSRPHQGTTVRVTIPLGDEPEKS